MAWFVAGHVALVIVALSIVKSGTYSILDVAYWLVIAFIIAVRWIDVSRFGGLTTDGVVATMGDWRRHAALLTLVGAAIWGLVHAGRYWFEQGSH